jgi:hypothetical protein
MNRGRKEEFGLQGQALGRAEALNYERWSGWWGGADRDAEHFSLWIELSITGWFFLIDQQWASY